MELKKYILEHEKKIIFILKILAVVLYLYGLIYQLVYFRYHISPQYWWDLRTYKEFTLLRPIYITGEEAYMCLYQPYFIWLWYPMTFLSLDNAYIVMVCINFPSLLCTLFYLLPKLNKIHKHLEKIILFIYLPNASINGGWQNIEYFVAMIYFWLWTMDIKDTKTLILHSFLASFWSFKILSLVFIPVFALKSKRFMTYMVLSAMILFSLNIYWVIQYPYIIDINFVIYAFKHGGYTNSLYLFWRPTFSVPLIWLIYIGIKKLKEEWMKNQRDSNG